MSKDIPGYILRSSVNASKHSLVDAELKYLKLASRRLHSVLTIHATELRIIQRLYYKNKNQHRGALFWRRVVELKRYSENLEKRNLPLLVDDLRSAFHGPRSANNIFVKELMKTKVTSANTRKGSWTHLPIKASLRRTLDIMNICLQVVRKMSARCLTSFESFHLSLQSAAFLQLLLMFSAVASRIRMLALELEEILQLVVQSVTTILEVATVDNPQGVDEQCMQLEVELAITGTPGQTHAFSGSTSALPLNASQPYTGLQGATYPQSQDNQMAAPGQLSRSAVEHAFFRTPVQNKDLCREAPKRKRRKKSWNEIDDIFGF